MSIAFSKILIPIDFSVNTESAINRTVSLIGIESGKIHLLHMVKPGKSAGKKFSLWDAEKKLTQWKAIIEESHRSLQVDTHIIKGISVQAVVIQFARLIDSDLIIIGKQQGQRPWWADRLSPSQRNARKKFKDPDPRCPSLRAIIGKAIANHHTSRWFDALMESLPDRPSGFCLPKNAQ